MQASTNSYNSNHQSQTLRHPQSSVEKHRPRQNLDRYTLLEKVGSGTYGVVYKAQDNQTGEVSNYWVIFCRQWPLKKF